MSLTGHWRRKSEHARCIPHSSQMSPCSKRQRDSRCQSLATCISDSLGHQLPPNRPPPIFSSPKITTARPQKSGTYSSHDLFLLITSTANKYMFIDLIPSSFYHGVKRSRLEHVSENCHNIGQQLVKCEDAGLYCGHGRCGEMPSCNWDEKIRWGRDSQHRQRPRAHCCTDSGAVEPQGRGIQGTTQCSRRRHEFFSPAEPQRAHPVSVMAMRMTPIVWRTLTNKHVFTPQFVPRGCLVARLETKKHGEVNHWCWHNMSPLSVRDVEESTTSRHPAVNIKMERKNGTGPMGTERFATFSLRWQPHDKWRHP